MKPLGGEKWTCGLRSIDECISLRSNTYKMALLGTHSHRSHLQWEYLLGLPQRYR